MAISCGNIIGESAQVKEEKTHNENTLKLFSLLATLRYIKDIVPLNESLPPDFHPNVPSPSVVESIAYIVLCEYPSRPLSHTVVAQIGHGHYNN